MCIRREYTDIQKPQKAEGGELLWGSVDENRDKNLAPTVTESAIFKLAADVSVDTAVRAPATAQELSYAPRVAPLCECYVVRAGPGRSCNRNASNAGGGCALQTPIAARQQLLDGEQGHSNCRGSVLHLGSVRCLCEGVLRCGCLVVQRGGKSL